MMLACVEGRRKTGRSRKRCMDGGNTHDVRDEPGGAEGCGGEGRGLWRRLAMTVVRIHRIDSTR